jgi:hypothetical protein
MPDSETFDAFYARTVWNVTSQLHELAGDDSAADHAIREAYAKAYQQWYQISGYPDSEGWVLATARDAYERRRAEAAGGGRSAAAEPSQSGTWPGFFRPAAQPGRNGDPQGQPFADPDGTLAPPRRGWAGRDGTSAASPGGAAPMSNYPAGGAVAGGALAGNGTPGSTASARLPADSPTAWVGQVSGTAPPTRELGSGGPGPYGPNPYALPPGGPGPYGLGPGPYGPGHGGPARNGLGGARLGGLATRRNLIVAGVTAAALVIVGITYYAVAGGHKTPAPAASQGPGAKSAGKPKQHMLAAGRTGPRSAIPWSLVGRGWALAELSTAAPNSAGQASGSGSYSTYLIDPEGGKYKITTSSGGTAPQLMAWSGDAQTALFNTSDGAAGGTSGYQLLNVRTGQLRPLPLPTGVVAIGFSRPDGLALLAVRQGPAEFRLQRYTLTGQLQASLASLRRKAGETLPSDGCSTACALSSPDGLADVWGIAGDEMQVLSNAGGKPHKLHVPDSRSCIPLSWWDNRTILADCLVTNLPDDATRLWLVPADRSAPTPLAGPTTAGSGRFDGAWRAGSAVYVTSVTSRQCTGVPNQPAGLSISPIGQAAAASSISITGATNNVNTVVATDGRRLLVLAQTSCPGTSSLFWFNPSAGSATAVLSAPASQAGVVAAVPYGNGPTALSAGQ